MIDAYRRWPAWARALLWPALALELVLVYRTERDIHRRSADEIRGPKLLWRLLATQNVVGPAAYRLIGRR